MPHKIEYMDLLQERKNYAISTLLSNLMSVFSLVTVSMCVCACVLYLKKLYTSFFFLQIKTFILEFFSVNIERGDTELKLCYFFRHNL